MPKFELKTLTSYDDKSLIDELRRVAALIPDEKLTHSKFDRLSKVKAQTLSKRFGGWDKALAAGGLEHRFDDSSKPWSRENLINELRRVAALIPDEKLTYPRFDRVSKVKAQTLIKRFGGWDNALAAGGLEHRFNDSQKPWSREEIIERLKSIAQRTGRNSVPVRELSESNGPSGNHILSLFGSYRAALEAAGLSLQSKKSIRYTDEDCYENLLTVWTALGRQPHIAELNNPPSKVGPSTYSKRWGSWRKALQAFVDRVNQDMPPEVQQSEICDVPCASSPSKTLTAGVQQAEVLDVPTDSDIKVKRKRTSRNIPLGLKYTVLIRDRSRCRLCGRSPTTSLNVELHFDHIKPWALGGETVLENLRLLCSDCNLGKGCREEEVMSPETTASGTDPSTSSG